MCVKRSFTS